LGKFLECQQVTFSSLIKRIRIFIEFYINNSNNLTELLNALKLEIFCPFLLIQASIVMKMVIHKFLKNFLVIKTSF